MPRRYRLFEVVGLELEYPLVDAELRAVARVEELFRRLAGRPTSEVDLGPVQLSNELAAHVLEIKNGRPLATLTEVERRLAEGLARVHEVLDEMGCGLLPGGMHPFMKPEEGELWRRSGRRIYETYARVFDIRRHGWMNVQSCHVNLPFGSADELPGLHNVLTCLLPYLPALTAASPIVEGRRGDSLDMRLVHYRSNQHEIPEITGDVVPGYMSTPGAYRREVLGAIYRRLDAIEGTGPIRHEFVNSRGVIPKFARSSLEMRTLDAQECPRMDVAMAAFVRGTAHALHGRLLDRKLQLPDHRLLVDDFGHVLAGGRQARVEAPHLGGPASAGEILAVLLGPASRHLTDADHHYLDLVEARLRHGSLAERVLEAVQLRTGAGDDDARSIDAVYRELATALRSNEPWRLH